MNAFEELIANALIHGERKATLRLAQARFDPLPEALAPRIATADQETLERLITSLLTATSPADVIAAIGSHDPLSLTVHGRCYAEQSRDGRRA